VSSFGLWSAAHYRLQIRTASESIVVVGKPSMRPILSLTIVPRDGPLKGYVLVYSGLTGVGD
jgi:hypothetical protein